MEVNIFSELRYTTTKFRKYYYLLRLFCIQLQSVQTSNTCMDKATNIRFTVGTKFGGRSVGVVRLRTQAMDFFL
jgi:hypothetical protein